LPKEFRVDGIGAECCRAQTCGWSLGMAIPHNCRQPNFPLRFSRRN